MGSMQITVFGASGRVGQQVVKAALTEGYSVVAFVHSHNPFPAQAKLQVVTGNVTDVEAVRQSLKGSEAVISTLGSWHTKSKDILSTGMRTVIPIMERLGIKRIITLTGAGALWSGDQPSALDKLTHRLLGLVAPKILRDSEEHLRLLAASSLDWTCMRSPVMTNGQCADYALRNRLTSAIAFVPRAAVVACLIDQLAATDFSRQAPVVYRT